MSPAVGAVAATSRPASRELVGPSRLPRAAATSFSAYLAQFRIGGLAPARSTATPATQPASAMRSVSAATPPATASPTRTGSAAPVDEPSPLTVATASRPTTTGVASSARSSDPLVSAGPSPLGVTTASRPTTTAIAPTFKSSGSLALADFPRPVGDNGRGMHWIPICETSDANVDRFVAEAEKMGVKWMVVLNRDTNLTDNEYLVKRLVEKGIMPIMRVYTPEGQPIQGDLEGLVRHYRALGVQYYQLYNEPNLKAENPDGKPNVDRYVDLWLRDAQRVEAAGGLPGFGALAPGGDVDDVEFLKQSLDRVKARGGTAVLDRAWLSLHNYTLNQPSDYAKDKNGYLKFETYNQVVREKLGRSVPIIGTEGGVALGSGAPDPATARQQVEMVQGAYDYVEQRKDPYYFAYSYWVIANEEGGGQDSTFSQQALFQPGRTSPIVEALRQTATG